MKKYLFGTFIAFALFALASCGGQTETVESGTYKGTIDKVKPDETEIYVKTKEGKTLELYFTEATKLTKDGKIVEFSKLKKGQKVEIKVEKQGKRLDPKTVKILE